MFLVAFGIGKRFFPISKNIAITYSSGMKNLPIAIGIAVMSFKGLVALPIALGAAFQMLTAAAFYRVFSRIYQEGKSGIH
jgi:predicted Na+-dependent transporter